MPTREITTNLKNEIALDVQAITSDTTTNGAIISVGDFDGGVNFTFFSGAYTDGSYIVEVIEGNDPALADGAAADDLSLTGQDPESTSSPEAQTVIGAANQIRKVGYVGSKAYVRLDVISTAVTTGATLGGVVEKMPEIKPATVTA